MRAAYRRPAILAAVVTACGFVDATMAADTPLLTDTKFSVDTIGGAPASCVVEFTLLYKDFVYRQGALVILDGSLRWFDKDSGLYAGLKLAAADAPGVLEGKQDATHVRIDRGSIAVDDKVIPPFKSIRGEDERDLLASYSPESASKLYDGLEKNLLSVVFNRQADGIDIHLPVHVDFNDASRARGLQDFNECMVVVAQRAVDRARK